MTMLTYSGSATGTGTVTLVTPATNSNQTLTLPDNTGTLLSTGSTGAVTPAMTQVGALPSMVRLYGSNGYGSTNTKIRRFSTTITNQGSDITYTDSATLGASFTTNANGVYIICYGDQFSALSEVGLSLNTTAPTTNIYLIPVTEILGMVDTPGAGNWGTLTWAGYLPSGSIVRPHTSGTGPGSNANGFNFTITRVA